MSDDDSPQQINLVRIGEHDVVPLGLILVSLRTMADNIRKQSHLEVMKDQLKGYNWLIGDNPDKWQLMKALAVAVNEAIQEKKIEPVDKNSKQVNEKLYDLLARGYEKMKQPQEYFDNVTFPQDLQITSPRVLAEVSLSTDAAQWVVASMIERQFEIKWDTPTGEPDDYSFYDFCDTENAKELFKYKPRLAHVKATLYKECRSKQQMLHELLQEPKNSLCPEVFVNTVDGWTTWKAHDEGNKEGKFRPLPENWFSKNQFIHQLILEFIKKNAQKQKSDDESLKESLKLHTLYWAVIEDRDFPPTENTKHLKLNPIGSTQVYVGYANKGIKNRWITDSKSHCSMMKKCFDNVCAMTTYDPVLFKRIQLVDARLALAKVRGEKTALFVIKTFGHDIPKKEKDLKQSENDLRDAQKQSKTVLTPPPAAHPDTDTQVTVSTNELLSPPAPVTDLEKTVKKKKKELDDSKSKAKADLKREEEWHRQGKREDNSDIIPSSEWGASGESWKPTEMEFGMNCF